MRDDSGRPLNPSERLRVLSQMRQERLGVYPEGDRRPRKSAKDRGCTARKRNICKSRGKVCQMSPKGRRLCVAKSKARKYTRLRRGHLPTRECTKELRKKCRDRNKVCHVGRHRITCRMPLEEKRAKARARYELNKVPHILECTPERVQRCLDKNKVCHVGVNRVTCRMTLEQKRAKAKAKRAKAKAEKAKAKAEKAKAKEAKTKAEKAKTKEAKKTKQSRKVSKKKSSSSSHEAPRVIIESSSASPPRHSPSPRRVIRRKTAQAIVGPLPSRRSSSSPLVVPGAMQNLFMPQGVVQLPEIVMPQPPRRSTRERQTPVRYPASPASATPRNTPQAEVGLRRSTRQRRSTKRFQFRFF